ncbi:MAG: hypothetical protein R2867_41460, partial [Caldilineaceae bacterium]
SIAKVGLISAILTAMIGLCAACITAYFGFLSNRTQVSIPIEATQTAETKLAATTESEAIIPPTLESTFFESVATLTPTPTSRGDTETLSDTNLEEESGESPISTFTPIPDTPAPTLTPIATDTINLTGEWLAEGYTCKGTEPPEKIIIEHKEGLVTATKITGDDCISAGEITWVGVFQEKEFIVQVQVSHGPNTARSFTEGKIQVINNDKLFLFSSGPTFYRIKE